MSAIDDWFGPDGALARHLPDYEERQEQLDLARAVEAALASGENLCAEAGTGVGKSFAYLLPAVLHALAREGQGPIVVSTRTIALQEQLERKDLPFLRAVTPEGWTAVTAVGRNNYVCLRRMNLARRQGDVLFDDGAHAELDRVAHWAEGTVDGLRMELDEPVQDLVWDEVKAEHGNCLHRACPHYDRCPYQRGRRRIDGASILVVNHALYMADVALRMAGAQYLPAHKAVIFDEAHHLERVATESLGLRLTLPGVLWHLRRLHPSRAQRSLLTAHGSPRARLLVDEVRDLAQGFFSVLEQRLGAQGATVALGDEALGDPLSEPLGELAAEVVGCAAGVEEVDAKMELQARARGLEALRFAVQDLVLPGGGARVRWVEREKRSVALRAAPLSVADTLARWVFTKDRACVLTSATLGPTDDAEFAWLRGQLGIARATPLRLGSPFDYRRSVVVEIAPAMPDPARESAAFLRACKERVCARVLENGGRALVLCTSWEFVRALAEALRPHLEERGIALLVQGEAPLRRLLDQKRSDVTSVLVGTESLWEGIDVRGDALTLVVVTRFPFAQPDHPLTRARAAAVLQRGGDPFEELSLPEAILKFRQGFGRLIRSATDRGRVLILDPRARTRAYGRRFLAALPGGIGEDDPCADDLF